MNPWFTLLADFGGILTDTLLPNHAAYECIDIHHVFTYMQMADKTHLNPV